MSKRERVGSEPDEEMNRETEERLPFNKKFKHTLDSDESDDELQVDANKYKLIEEDALDGEEEGELHREDEITITPFNMKDELREGHFDSDGMYIFDKNEDEIKDNWIDNIDWVKIKETDDLPTSKTMNETSVEPVKLNVDECLKRLIELMNPNETVQKAIQRLGKSKLKNANRHKNRQRAKQLNQASSCDSKEEQEENERKEKLNCLLDLSNQLLSDGDMNIYETKLETLKYRLEESKKKEEVDIFGE